MANPIAFSGVTRSGTRYSSQRINRRLDDRDNVLKESLIALEKKAAGVYPTIYLVKSDSPMDVSNIEDGLVLTVVGANLSTDATDWDVDLYDATGAAIAPTIASQTATGAELTWGSGALNYTTGFTQGSALLQIRIGDCLAFNGHIEIRA